MVRERERERQKKNIAKKFRAAPPNPKPKRIPPEELSRKESPKAQSFHIVGVGASAGGLEAFTRLLQALPTNTGMGLVLIQHLDPKSDSILTQILSQKTKLPVKEAKDGLAVEPDHVYIMPPNRNMTISGGVLGLSPRTDIRGRHMPIDRFFRSLAEDQKSRAIAVVLSGTASDGAVGLSAIKAEGGITFAQDEKSAKFGGMPHSAAAAGAADFILPPEGIAQELARISRHPFAGHKIPTAEGRESLILPNGNGLSAIFTLLKSATGVDFAHYKQATLKRRILRRINLRRMKDLGDYAKFLEDNPGEVEALYHDLLIHITGFFRDPEAFAALADKVFPEITRNRGLRESPVRVWVPGCSTGEEAYSLAIALMEFLGRKAREIPIQIFATDIFEEAINKARTGRYPEAISSDLSAERLDRFFVKMDGGYQVIKFIREMCVFAKHDLTKDPPFSNVDLVSCRNVMIYLGQESQRRAMAAFHYSLKPAGFLLLGKSEAMGRFPDLFAPVDGKHKIYSKKPGPGRPYLNSGSAEYGLPKIDIGRKGKAEFDFRKEADRTLLARFAPAGVIVNHGLEVLEFRGRTGPFLEHGPGQASLNLLKIAREGIQLPLRMAVQEAKKQSVPARKKGLQVKFNGQVREVNLEVIPLKAPGPGEDYFLVLFEDASPRLSDKPASGSVAPVRSKGKQRTAERERGNAREELLERELEEAKGHLRSIMEEHESATQDLRAANEEVLSANEELQSVNEELETAKEELESTNEELTTLNDELRNRNFTLDKLNSDLMNLFASANLPILILGGDLCLRRFTPLAEKRLGVTAADIGRSILNMRLQVDVPDLETLILTAIDQGTAQQKEVQDREGVWYSLWVRPYKTLENKIDGAVLTWIEIHELKRAMQEMTESREYADAIIATVREPLVILDPSLRIQRANPSFYQTFRTSPAETENRLIYDLGNRQWNIPELKRLLEEILPQNAFLHDFDVEHEFPVIGHRVMQLNARRILQNRDRSPLILLAIEDITERKRAEQEVRKSQDDLERRVQDRTADLGRANEELRNEIIKRENVEQQVRHMEKMDAIGTLTGGIAHDLNNILAPIIINSEMALLDIPAESSVRDLLTMILKSGVRGKDLVTQLLLFSRKSQQQYRIVPLSPLIKETLKLLRSSLPSSAEMKLSLETDSDLVRAHPSQIQQVIMNLCTNAAYALRGTTGSIELSLQAIRLDSDLPEGDMEPGDYLVLSVKDSGCGMDPEVKNRIFEPFFTTKPPGEGTGLGLSAAHGIVKSHKGGITVHSEPGKGSVFKVYLPRVDSGVSVEAEALTPIPGGNERILVVDDEEVVVNAVRNMLQHLGYQVTVVTNSQEALKIFSENPSQFDLVMTDQTMPFMTGENLGKELMRLRPDIPVILCTGYSDFIASEKATAMGFRGFIMKPFTAREGAELVRSVLDQSPPKITRN